MFISIFCTLTITFLTLSYIYFTRNYNYWKKKKIYFVKPKPFVGCMWQNVCLKITAGEILGDLYKKINRDFFGIYVFDRPILVIKSPKLIKDILIKDFDYFRDRTARTFDDSGIISNFMFFKHGPEWKIVREKMSPVFTTGKLKLMYEVILKESDLMIDYINRKFIDLPNVEAKEICAKFSTNVIARCCFGVEANCFQNENAEFRKIGKSLFAFNFSNALRQGGAFYFPVFMQLFKIGFFEASIINRVSDIFNQVLQERMKMNKLKGSDLIDILLEHHRKAAHQKEFSSDVAMAQALQLFFAGFETVASSLSFTFYELAMHPEIQTKLRGQIQALVKEHGHLAYDSLMNLKYLDMVISEAQRKYPALPLLDRECVKDYKLPDTDIVLEKGTGIYIPLFGIHYDEEYYPNPQKFIPERFEDKNKLNQDGLRYLPFGEGPRHCIGMRFASITTRIGLAQILLNYELLRTDQTPEFIELQPAAILIQSKTGVPIKFKPL